MATLAAGASTTVTLAAGDKITVASGAIQSMIGPGPRANQQRLLTAGGQLGPFDRSQAVYLTALSDAVYSSGTQTTSPLIIVSASAPVDADGRPDGTVYIQTA